MATIASVIVLDSIIAMAVSEYHWLQKPMVLTFDHDSLPNATTEPEPNTNGLWTIL